MALQEYTFPYGHGTKSFKLDDSQVIKTIRTNVFPVIKDYKKAILDSLRHPIGSPSLEEIIKPGDSVAFIVNDPTRVANSELFMPIFFEEMHRLGVKDEDMKCVFALGSHRAMTEEEMMREVGGPEYGKKVRLINSIAKKEEDFQYFGKTSRGTPVWIHKELCNVDHIIMTGTVVEHYFAGFGGGKKAILPGCAMLETIRVNHSFMLDPHSGLGKTKENPVYEDQLEGVALFAKGRSLFLFNDVLNAKHEFLGFFTGNYIKAHEEACKFCEKVYGDVIPHEGDLVIASCGGWPKDINVYQMQKTMDNAVLAARQGGVVILLAECEEGAGHPLLEKTFHDLKTYQAIHDDLEKHFMIGANKAYAVARPQQKAHFILVTKLDHKLAKEMLFTGAVDTVEEALELAKQYVGDKPKIVLMPEGSLTVPIVKP